MDNGDKIEFFIVASGPGLGGDSTWITHDRLAVARAASQGQKVYRIPADKVTKFDVTYEVE